MLTPNNTPIKGGRPVTDLNTGARIRMDIPDIKTTNLFIVVK